VYQSKQPVMTSIPSSSDRRRGKMAERTTRAPRGLAGDAESTGRDREAASKWGQAVARGWEPREISLLASTLSRNRAPSYQPLRSLNKRAILGDLYNKSRGDLGFSLDPQGRPCDVAILPFPRYCKLDLAKALVRINVELFGGEIGPLIAPTHIKLEDAGAYQHLRVPHRSSYATTASWSTTLKVPLTGIVILKIEVIP
jgi:hypothetical protein